MAGRGSKPGERRGGRKRGVPNRTTTERQLIAQQEQTGAPILAKQVLCDLLQKFTELAAAYAERDAEKFEKWSRHAVDTARILAPFQSPTLRAVLIEPPGPVQEARPKRFTLRVFTVRDCEDSCDNDSDHPPVN